MTEQKYYVYGSGMFGCLYDYGPNFCEDLDGAIDSFVQLFGGSISEEELIELKDNLKQDGMHKFSDPYSAGAHYCQISEEFGEMPESDD